MPIREYQCYGCGLRFDKSVSRKVGGANQICESCGAEAVCQDDSLSYGFNLSATGPEPQNTGVSEYDMMVDRVVGKNADDRWSFIERRDAYKREFQRQKGATPRDLSRNPDGSYRVMTERERRSSENHRGFNILAMDLINKMKQSAKD